MSRKCNLEDGVYWFYGYPTFNNNEAALKFSEFLDNILGKGNYFGYTYETGDETDPSCIIGIFKLCISCGRPERLSWISKSIDILEFNSIRKICPQLSMYEDVENNYLVDFKGSLINEPGVINFSFRPGVTDCNESCLFWKICCEDPDSIFNPSLVFLDCKKYVLNKGKYERRRDETFNINQKRTSRI